MKVSSFFTNAGKPIAYYPEFAKALGTVNGAILVCQFLYWTGKQKNKSGWIYKSQKEICEETALSRHEQDTARKKLVELEVLEVIKRGVPATLNYRVNTDRLEEIIDSQFAENQQTSLPKSDKLDFRNVASKIAENQQTITETTQENTTENVTYSFDENSLEKNVVFVKSTKSQDGIVALDNTAGWPLQYIYDNRDYMDSRDHIENPSAYLYSACKDNYAKSKALDSPEASEAGPADITPPGDSQINYDRDREMKRKHPERYIPPEDVLGMVAKASKKMSVTNIEQQDIEDTAREIVKQKRELLNSLER